MFEPALLILGPTLLISGLVSIIRALIVRATRGRWANRLEQQAKRLVVDALEANEVERKTWPARRRRALSEHVVQSRPLEDLASVRGIGPKTLHGLRTAGLSTIRDVVERGRRVRGIGETLRVRIAQYVRHAIARADEDAQKGRLELHDAQIELRFDQEKEALERRHVELLDDREALGRGELGVVAPADRLAGPALGLLADPSRGLRLWSCVAVAAFVAYLLPSLAIVLWPADATLLAEAAEWGAVIAASIVLFYHYVVADISAGIDVRSPDPASFPEQRLQTHAIQMALQAGVTPPRVLVQESQAYNAYAQGTSSGPSRVVLNAGLVRDFREDEVLAVLGHEITHLRHNDLRALYTQSFTQSLVDGVATILVALAGVFLLVSDQLGRVRGRRQERDTAAAMGCGVLLLALVLYAAYVPVRVISLASQLIHLASGREDEFRADRGAAELLGSSEPMVRALERLDAPSGHPRPTLLRARMIVDPARGLSGPVGFFESVLSTHPSTARRIRRLKTDRSPASRALRVGWSWFRFAVVLGGLVVTVCFLLPFLQGAAANRLLVGSAGQGEASSKALDQVEATRACDLWMYDPQGRPFVARRVSTGEVFDEVGRDQRSTQVVEDGRPAWLVNRCLRRIASGPGEVGARPDEPASNAASAPPEVATGNRCEDLPAGDVVLDGTHRAVEAKHVVSPAYPAAALAMGFGESRCEATITVDVKGVPEEVAVARCPEVFHEEAKRAMYKSRWWPYRPCRRARRVRFPVMITFRPH
ncbi:MAG: M48 family metalloprotease [Myxococcota bacterium]